MVKNILIKVQDHDQISASGPYIAILHAIGYYNITLFICEIENTENCVTIIDNLETNRELIFKYNIFGESTYI